MPSVSIAIQPDVFDRFSELNFKPSQAIAEFIDNAIQSYLDYKDNGMFYYPGYKLIVDVIIDWEEAVDHKTYAKSITIRDNAAGMALPKYEKAFETGHRPAFNEGLNEYGMGMKTAAFWLSQQWRIVSKSFSEDVERTLFFDVEDIVMNGRTELDFDEKIISDKKSYTIVSLEKLYKKNNFTKRMLGNIRSELASIYRAFLRRGEIQINVNNEALVFKDPQILNAPYYSDPNGPKYEWKVQISKNMFGKEINGYIGILNEMSEKQSGLVILRRGRVIVGESRDHLYHPKCISGSATNSHRYKRIYGEIEIKGFSASFNKNGFSNVEELETMLDLLKNTLRVGGNSLITQAEKMRLNTKPTPASYKVKWKFENGQPDIIETYSCNAILSIPKDPQKQGFTFEGWNPNPQTYVTSDLEYIAKWKLNTMPIPAEYEVRWIFNNGQNDRVVRYKKGDTLVVPKGFSKPGCEFVGWAPAPVMSVNADAKYQAIWKEISTKPQQDILVSRVFEYEGNIGQMDLVKNYGDSPLLVLDMKRYNAEGVVVGKLNVEKLPNKEASLRNNELIDFLLSLAISMFKTQMNGDDTCESLMKFYNK